MSLPSSSSSPSLVVSGCEEFVPSRPGVPIWGTMKCSRCSVERRLHVGGIAPFDPAAERRSSSQSSPSNSSTSSNDDFAPSSSSSSSSSAAAQKSVKSPISTPNSIQKRDSGISPTLPPTSSSSQKRESGSMNLNVNTQKRLSSSSQKRESINSPIGAESDVYGTAAGRGVGQTNGTASGSLASFIGSALGIKHSGRSSGMTKNRDDQDEENARSYHQLNQQASQQLAKAIAGLVVKPTETDNTNNKAIGFLHKKASSTSS